MRAEDTCNVWVNRSGADALSIDLGAGEVLDRLDELEIGRITDVLVTHHHRDNVQGLARAVEAGGGGGGPPRGGELFPRADEGWRRYRPESDYDLRDFRFSLLEPVQIAGVVSEYRSRDYGGIELYALPPPGHTIGSVTYLAELGGRRVAFTGDLLYAPGKVWSLAATQWTYGGVEGRASTRLSCGGLARYEPDVLLPSHGEPMDDPAAALDATREALTPLITM